VFFLWRRISEVTAVLGIANDVRITQLDWKRVPQARSRGCKSSVAITTDFAAFSSFGGYFEVYFFVTFAGKADIVMP